jgi:hypothetical protein
MNEVENKAIQKFSFKEFKEKVGWPTYEGRIGQRALQEILEIDTEREYRGLSIMQEQKESSLYFYKSQITIS